MSNDDTILAHNRIGTEAEVEQYRMEEYKSFSLRPSARRSVFATGVFQRVAFATALSLGLQWGTTGVALLIHLNTPPKGIGCHAIAFTVLNGFGILVSCIMQFTGVYDNCFCLLFDHFWRKPGRAGVVPR